MSTSVQVYEATKTLGYKLLKLRSYPHLNFYEIKVKTNGPEYACYVDFLIEMRLRGYRIKDTIHVTETHFCANIKKIE